MEFVLCGDHQGQVRENVLVPGEGQPRDHPHFLSDRPARRRPAALERPLSGEIGSHRTVGRNSSRRLRLPSAVTVRLAAIAVAHNLGPLPALGRGGMPVVASCELPPRPRPPTLLPHSVVAPQGTLSLSQAPCAHGKVSGTLEATINCSKARMCSNAQALECWVITDDGARQGVLHPPREDVT